MRAILRGVTSSTNITCTSMLCTLHVVTSVTVIGIVISKINKEKLCSAVVWSDAMPHSVLKS